MFCLYLMIQESSTNTIIICRNEIVILKTSTLKLAETEMEFHNVGSSILSTCFNSNTLLYSDSIIFYRERDQHLQNKCFCLALLIEDTLDKLLTYNGKWFALQYLHMVHYFS